MAGRFYLLLFGCIVMSCGTGKPDTSYPSYTVKSYLELKLDPNGRLPSNPYTLTFSQGSKQIVFCGVNHVGKEDIDNPMYREIERQFQLANPQVCINEGGDISKFIYSSRREAIAKHHEMGLAKALSDSANIRIVNGDMPENMELERLIRQYSLGRVIAYITVERLMWSVKGQTSSLEDVAKSYQEFVNDYLVAKCGLKLSRRERSFSFFCQHYEQLLHRPFDLNTLEPTNPFDSVGTFQEIGRSSKKIRDQHLLAVINNQLKYKDRVFVVFGGWHLLACEPGLREIISKY